jgi:hypothetical protein
MLVAGIQRGGHGMGATKSSSNGRPERHSVDLSQHPDLVVIYLGMRVNSLRGIKTLLSFGPKIAKAVGQEPDGLLLHENLIFSLFPLHAGMRQYWRDFDSLERWARSGAHAQWWKGFLVDRAGTGFWHETYFRGGQIESVYIDMPPIGLSRFAPVEPARGSMFSARRRLGLTEESSVESAIPENELYGG